MLVDVEEFGYLLQEALADLNTMELQQVDIAATEIHECIWNTGKVVRNV